MNARARAAAAWTKPVPRDRTYRCVQCGHDFVRVFVGIGREGLAYCNDIASCNARMRVESRPAAAHDVMPTAPSGETSP